MRNRPVPQGPALGDEQPPSWHVIHSPSFLCSDLPWNTPWEREDPDCRAGADDDSTHRPSMPSPAHHACPSNLSRSGRSLLEPRKHLLLALAAGHSRLVVITRHILILEPLLGASRLASANSIAFWWQGSGAHRDLPCRGTCVGKLYSPSQRCCTQTRTTTTRLDKEEDALRITERSGWSGRR